MKFIMGCGKLGRLPVMVVERFDVAVWALLALFMLFILLLELFWWSQSAPMMAVDTVERERLAAPPWQVLEGVQHYRLIVEKQLFSPDRKADRLVDESPKMLNKVPQDTKLLGLKLVGTLVSDAQSVALIKGKQGVMRVHEGEKVAGSYVVEVGMEYVVMQTDGVLEMLHIRPLRSASEVSPSRGH